MTNYLTPAEYSEKYKVKKGTLAHLRCKGKGPKFIKIGKQVRYLDPIDEQQETQ